MLLFPQTIGAYMVIFFLLFSNKRIMILIFHKNMNYENMNYGNMDYEL